MRYFRAPVSLAFPFATVPLLAPLAAAQYSARLPAAKPLVTRAAPPAPGGYLGADDCGAPHTAAGVGDQTAVPFTTGTTGTTGQSEASCYAFGSSGIDSDVWFDWTSTTSGNARVTTCGGTGVDTKIAVWPSSTCPPDGTSLACNDDACSLQSTVVWTASASTTYTLQIGTFPGASGGSGTFDVTVSAPPPCGQYDDGTTENALGLTAGGEMGWIHSYSCLTSFDSVETAYGSALFPGSVTNGNNSRVAVYDDDDIDPGNGAVLLMTASTVVVNGDTDILNKVALPGRVTRDPTTPFHVRTHKLATADHVAGEFPGPMDQDNPTPEAWVVGSTLGPGTMDLANLANNNVPPLNMTMIGFPAAWLLRADDTGSGGTGTALCFGDGSGAPCGCGNESAPGAGGCLNSVGAAALLTASGSADTTSDTMSLTCDGVINQPGLFFQGNNAIGGGAGVTFGDGIRCCGQNVVRIQVVNPPGTMSPATAVMTETATTNGPMGTIQPGDTKCYQYWYRDPAGGGVCGASFNLSNAVSVTWV